MCVVWEGFISELTAIPFPQWLALSQASCPTLCGGVIGSILLGGTCTPYLQKLSSLQR